VLQPGSPAQVVNVGEAPLRARRGPSINEPVQARFPAGTQLTVLEGPVEADGYIWWRVEADGASGWSAERSQEGTIWLEPLPAPEPPPADAPATDD
jgi:hypothetical protein